MTDYIDEYIGDIFYPIKDWPAGIRRIWADARRLGHFTHNSRFKLIQFMLWNGMDPDTWAPYRRYMHNPPNTEWHVIFPGEIEKGDRWEDYRSIYNRFHQNKLSRTKVYDMERRKLVYCIVRAPYRHYGDRLHLTMMGYN